MAGIQKINFRYVATLLLSVSALFVRCICDNTNTKDNTGAKKNHSPTKPIPPTNPGPSEHKEGKEHEDSEKNMDLDELAEALASKGIDLKKAMEQGQSALELAAEHTDNPQIIQKILGQGDATELSEESNKKLLQTAIRSGNLNIAQFLVDQSDPEQVKESLNERYSTGIVWLHKVAKTGDLKTIEFILAHGGKADITDSNGLTPLDRAIDTGQKEAIALLLKYNANINYQSKDGFTPVFSVIFSDALDDDRKKIDMLEFLQARGADLHRQEIVGNNLLHWAQIFGGFELTEWLVNEGVALDQPNEFDETPLSMSCEQLVDFIAEMGNALRGSHRADMTATEVIREKLTAFNSNLQVIQLLIEQGADINRVDKKGKSPLDYLYQVQKDTLLQSYPSIKNKLEAMVKLAESKKK